MSQRLVSGIQPSGELHLGNYLGAVAQWVELVRDYDAYVFVADLHAVTVPQEPEDLTAATLEIVRTYLAAGLDPERTTIWAQSSVSAHTELGWALSCFAKMGEMEKMTQFKDKAQRDGAPRASLGLFSYPALMAADILLYDAEIVPVGDDQSQHVELTRTLAERFNNRYGETFVVPTAHVHKAGARIMGLDNPEKKMSKSAASVNNYIALSDAPEVAQKKIMKAVTDSGADITYTPERPGLQNLLNIYSLLTGRVPEEIVAEYTGKGFGDFKRGLAEVVAAFLTDFQKRSSAISDDAVRAVLAAGSERAAVVANAKRSEVYKKMGFVG